MKRLLYLGALCAMAVSQPAFAEQMTLRVDATPSIFADMFREIAADFEKQNPEIKINLDVSARSQEDIIQTTLRQALVNDLPDVSFQGFNNIRLLADRDIAVRLDDRIANDTAWTTDISPSVTNSSAVNGKTYGLGVAFSLPVLFYNRNLVDEVLAGNSFPKTWNGVLKLAEDIRAKHPERVGLYFRPDALTFQALVASKSGQFMTSDESALSLEDQTVRDSLEFIRKVGEIGMADAAMTRDQARQAFASGNIAIMTDFSSGIGSRSKAVGSAFAMGVAPFPLEGSAPSLPTAGISMVLTTRDNARQEAALEFMKYVLSVSGQEAVARATSYVPANDKVIESSDSIRNLLHDDPLQKAVLASLPHAGAWYAFPGSNSVKIDDLVGQEVERVVSLRQAPDEAIEKLNASITPLLP